LRLSARRDYPVIESVGMPIFATAGLPLLNSDFLLLKNPGTHQVVTRHKVARERVIHC
jgi:hypothetical protein